MIKKKLTRKKAADILMSDEKSLDQKREDITALVRLWRDRLMLNNWTIDCVFSDKPSENDTDNAELYADINVLPEYMKASIKFFPCIFDKPIDKQVNAIVHELVHCLTNELYYMTSDLRNGRLVTPDNARQALERLTQSVTNIVVQMNWEPCKR